MPARRASEEARGKKAASPKRAAAKREDGLREYRGKRDFAATGEPRGAAKDRGSDDVLRFVIQEHHATRLHWDLRLEHDGALASWALPKGIPEAPKENRFAARTEDHPLEYLDFHGVIPQGQYGAGKMTIWDRGTYELLKWEPRKIEVALHGERLDARYALFPISSTAPGEQGPPKEWMIHRMDPPADAGRELMPEHLKPMLARPGKLPRSDRGWTYEVKWDGVRALAYSTPGELRLESRNLKEITSQYPELARLNRALSSHAVILDGEIVAFDEQGKPSFAVLQRRMHVSSPAQVKRLAQATPVTYMIFDLLWLNGHSLMSLPYEDRRELLQELDLNGASWQTPEPLRGKARDVLNVTAEQGLEGIVAKRLDSAYDPGARTTAWIKIKNVGRQELVVGGWLRGEGRRAQRVGALLVGVYEPDGAFRYAGRVGTGFSDAELDRLGKLLDPLQRENSPFTAGERPPRQAIFVEPRLVAEIEFAEWTSAGILRAPSYKGLREDKDAREVVREDLPSMGENARDAPDRAARKSHAKRSKPAAGRTAREPGGALSEPLVLHEQGAEKASVAVEGRELKLSNLGKTLYPKADFRKREVIDYYAAIAETILPHLQGRALTVKRWPDGVEGKAFFQKQAPAHRPDWVRTVTVPSSSKPIDYLLCDDRATLVWLANLAALELHVPLARGRAPERPTTLVFDLDPGPPASAIECCRVALTLQAMFENLGLQSFVKTSGKKGLQLYIPLNDPKISFEQTKPFAKAVAELLEQAEPELIVSRMTKAQRPGKVLIDWSQNDRNKTTVGVYSLRAAERPTVSTPLTWDEVRAALDRGDPDALRFEADAVLERIAEHGDLFAPVLSLVQKLPSV
ncbi:MAG TPA: DNA ligase D [Solirubrobacteraceae bacterium]|nr:DNA ligase D [Solirubrobacteraceae bacterium]